jgi:hypothetical protein
VLIYRISNSASSDSVTSISGPFTGASAIGPANNFASDAYLWTYLATGTGASGAVTVNFSSSASNTGTFIYVLQLSGDNTAGVVAQNTAGTGSTSPITSSWTNSNSTNGEIVVGAALDHTNQSITINSPSTGSWSPTTYSGNNGTIGYGMGLFETSSAQSSISASLSSNQTWGVVAVELNHG